MAKSCRRCEMLETYEYWYQLPADGHQFFKIMLGGFRHQLRIPTKFTMYFKEELANEVSLQGPSRNKWTVELTRKEEDVFFQNGWEKFVLDHSLEEADFLVFRYSGNSSFTVSIFDASGCERESAYYVEKHKNSCSHSGTVKVNTEAESVEINETSHNDNGEKSLQDGNLENGSDYEVSETNWFERHCQEKKQKMCSSSSRVPSKRDKNSEKEPQIAKSSTKVDPMRRPAVDESRYPDQKQASVPSLKITMQHKNVCKDFIKELPHDWVVKLLPNRKQAIQFRNPRSENKWAAQIMHQDYGSSMGDGPTLFWITT